MSNTFQVFRKNFVRQSVAMVIVSHLINISIDTVDPVMQQGFWITEIESFFELVSEQVLGMENYVTDQDESDMEQAISSCAQLLVADVVYPRTFSPDFKPIFVITIEATLIRNSLYSDISSAILTPPPRTA